MTDSEDIHEIHVPAFDYLASLALVDKVVPVIDDADGAELWRLGEEHFIVLACDCGIEHTGHEDIARLAIPAAWECFHVGYNLVEEWEAYHYGPVLPGDPVTG